ncbi:acireductone dioxygenase (Ni2+-requiring) [Sugiyamaella lignohabitans]|uniref:Acireductone dioxygenase n=1 Tax=Sugiyamaella lignohabitans TaxID=796027 RepID=A0A167EBM8_9ASCO|nr:acireductone dioxygenase (Ni2+-requiring) [Sugiyamaella lignohabitans]ANB13875.1 acireductone dioxygenase (Ni2+-requiring) [Sugiyamaella lignohabitans]
MKIYYHDGLEGDQRLRHDSGKEVTVEELDKLAVKAYHFDDIKDVDKLAESRNYINRDVINVSPEALGGKESYETKIKTFYTEHLHEDEEIRYVLDGEGYFDVRDKSDRWIRCLLTKGDLLILPAGIYHRFTTASNDYIQAMRLFQAEPKWIPHNRPCDNNEYRVEYVKSISV